MVINDTYDNRYSPNCKLHHHHYHHHLSTEEQATIVLLRFTWSKAMAVIHLQNFQVIKPDNLMTSQHGALSELGKYSTKKIYSVGNFRLYPRVIFRVPRDYPVEFDHCVLVVVACQFCGEEFLAFRAAFFRVWTYTSSSSGRSAPGQIQFMT